MHLIRRRHKEIEARCLDVMKSNVGSKLDSVPLKKDEIDFTLHFYPITPTGRRSKLG